MILRTALTATVLAATVLAASASAFAAAHKTTAGPADLRSPRTRFDQCVKQSDADPTAAVADAKNWAGSGGGVLAGQCLGIAQAAAGDDGAAAESFTAAATLAATLHDDRAATLWVSAGNAALAAGDTKAAHTALDNAIGTTTMPVPLRGEAFLDRARVKVAEGAMPAARSDMDEALRLVPGDPMGWLLSATLARRMGDLTRANADIREAGARAPNEAAILYEAGNIAATGGDMAQARSQWGRAHAADPDSTAGKSAAAEIAATGGDMPVPRGKGPAKGR